MSGLTIDPGAAVLGAMSTRSLGRRDGLGVGLGSEPGELDLEGRHSAAHRSLDHLGDRFLETHVRSRK